MNPTLTPTLTLAEFFTYLHRLDVQLWVDGDRLRVNAPKGVLTPDLNAELSRRKAELIGFLRTAQTTAQPPALPLRPVPRDQALPLSFTQQRLWFLAQMEPGNTAYNLSGVIQFSGPLNITALEQSLGVIIERHEVLRSTVAVKNGQPSQRIMPPQPFALPVIDLRSHPDTEREAEAERLCREAARTPFDLTQGPLFRLQLLRLADEVAQLSLTWHHLIADGWSMEVFLRELETLYRAFVHGESHSLPDLPVQYADFAYWQRHYLQGEVLENQLAYWQQQLGGALPMLDLPTDHPRPAVQTFNGAKLSLMLPEAITPTLKALARQEDATLFMVLLAAFKTLLLRHTGQTDLIVGTPVAGRNRAETENLMGCFINNIPLRTDLSGDPTFREALRRVRQSALAGYAHQELPFEKLVEALHLHRDISRSPLFQVMFLQNNPAQPLEFGGLTVEAGMIDNGAAMFDVTMYVQEVGQRLGVLVEYNTDLFEAATMQRFLAHYQTLLEGIAANPEQPLSALPLLTEAERRQLLLTWNETEADYPRHACLHQLIEAQAAQTPAAIAAEFEEAQLSYQALNQRANQVARHLQSLGIKPGTLVAVYTERSLEMLVGLLGILKAGGAYLPLDPAFPRERLAFMLDDAGAAVVLTQQRLLDELPPTTAQVVCLDTDWDSTLAHYEGENIASTATPTDLAYVIYTSGSTGKPKGVQLAHRNVVNFLTSMRREPGLQPQDILLAVTTLSFDIAGLELFLPLIVGAKVVIASRAATADGQQLARLLDRCGATVMQATPATWRLLLQAGWPGSDRLKILCGGEAFPRELADQLLGRCASLWNMYGPTETTIWSTVYRVTPDEGLISVGRPIANTQIYLLDATMQPVPIGVPGELYIGGDGVARGYLNRPELTAEKFISDYRLQITDYRLQITESRLETELTTHNSKLTIQNSKLYKTGDLARYLPDGNIEFLGRMDHQVKLRGFRIELGEIEACLGQHLAIKQAVVVMREDAPGDKRLAAYLISAVQPPPSVNELRSFLKERLPDYMVPAAFVTLAEMPLTPNGKVNRRALPAPDNARPDLETTYEAPHSEVEQTIAAIWQEALNLERVGVHDNFFDLGGHSLLLAQVHSKLQAQLNTNLSIISLFQYPTISLLAQHLTSHANGKAPARPLLISNRNGATPHPATESRHIAIIGLAGRFPGAQNIAEFWQNLCDGVEGVTFFSDDELRAAGVNPALLSDPHYVKARAVLDNVEWFDAPFFGFNPKEAELTDPQHRLFLECAWEALETAGYAPAGYNGAIGVYAGSSMNTYLLSNLAPTLGGLDAAGGYQMFVGNDKDFLPTRVSYKLNLTGPSVNIQTACSTSLVAVHYACQGLLTGECDMALAGGISISMPRRAGYLYQEGMILSPDGHCRAFDAAAQGTISGEGVGIVLLKRLDEALADGDQIYAVLRGSAINNDGSLKVGYTAPSVAGQAEAIATAQAVAGVEPDTISYIEAHGTGTPLGDPVEMEALTEVFRAATPRTGFCAIGSVKTNIGHLDAAAGVAGLIKTVLALHHKKLPPSLHFETPNPEIDFAHSPFFVNNHLRDWPANGTLRRAGVSSFGIGGTNAHVVLEEAPAPEPAPSHHPWQLLVLSAKTEAALSSVTAQLTEHLPAHPNLPLADVAYTLQVGRQPFEWRRALVCTDKDETVAALQTVDPQRVLTGQAADSAPSVVFMFPGQGAQYVNMALELYQTEPTFREIMDQCDELLRPHLGGSLLEAIYPDGRGQGTGVWSQEPESEGAGEQGSREQESINHSSFIIHHSSLKETWLTQPALFVIEYALARLWQSWGVQPQAMIGHSIGEYVAACLAGVFSLEDALALVAARGRLMQALPAGAMLAVSLSEEALLPLLPPALDLATINGPALCVVSGPHKVIDDFQNQLEQQEIACRRLHTSHAFHSAMMTPALEPFTAEVQKVALHPPQIPVISNVTGNWLTPAQATDPGYWADHLRQAVRFVAGLDTLLQDSDRLLLEVGPGHTLSMLARQARAPRLTVVSSLRHPKERRSDVAFLLEAVGRVWLNGVAIDWPALHADEQRRRVALPTYPFERQRYWVEPNPAAYQALVAQQLQGKKPDMADWFYLPSWKRQEWPRPVEPREADVRPWLVFVDDAGLGATVAERLQKEKQAAITVRAGKKFKRVSDNSFSLNPHAPDDYEMLLAELEAAGRLPHKIIHLWTVIPLKRQAAGLWDDQTQALGFYSLLYLAQALGRRLFSQPVTLQVVSNRLQLVTGAEALAPAKATLLGPCRVIPQEYPDIRCQSVDVDWPAPAKASPQKLAGYLLAEIAADPVEPVVAYRGAFRWAQIFERLPLKEIPADNPGLRLQGAYLITGGLGGIGLTLAEELARSVRARLVLVGRSVLPVRDDWPHWLETHPEQNPASQKIRRVQALEALGAEVLVLSADVADADQMQAVLQQAQVRFGPLHGVIHAAGVVAATAIQEIDRPAAEQQFQSKGRGLAVLAEALRGQTLDFCLVTSSLASVLGGLGYSAYAAANLYMDAFVAQQNRQADTPWISLNWDAWRAADRPAAGAGFGAALADLSMTPAEGVETFRRVLARGSGGQVVVSTGDLQARIDRWVKLDSVDTATPQITPPARYLSADRQDYVAPGNETERKLAGIWQEILGLEQVGVNDNFFDLGGSSLVAVRLFARIEQGFGQRLPLATLFDAPTIAQLAGLLGEVNTAEPDRPQPVRTVSWSSLVPIQTGGSKPPLFFVHAAGGNVLIYRDVARHLGADQPVYGLQAQGLEGDEPILTRVEEMAAFYIKELQTVQPEGPYLLGGYCMGGTVAIEMAQQLRAQGQPVAFVGAFETYNWRNMKLNTLPEFARFYLQKIEFHARNFMMLNWPEKKTFLGEKIKVAWDRRHVWYGNLLSALGRQNSELDEKDLLPAKVWATNDLAALEYQPKVYPGRITHFRPLKEYACHCGPDLGWDNLAAGVDTYRLPVYPAAMFVEPFVGQLARQLAACLDQSLVEAAAANGNGAKAPEKVPAQSNSL